MTLTIDGITSWDHRGDATKTRRSRRLIPGDGFGRRTFLRGLGAGAVGVGLATVGQLPVARKAEAACVSSLNTNIKNNCPSSYDYGCTSCGPSTVYGDVCGTNSYHKYTGAYRNRPDQCDPGNYDGWRWLTDPGTCGCASEGVRNYRCHDGCKKISGNWVNSICRPYAACLYP